MVLTIGELFGGVGTPRMALRNLGVEYKSKYYVEIEDNAVKSYNAIFNENYNSIDIKEFIPKHSVDVLVHGSPCTDFSLAGKRLGDAEGTQSSLMWETVRIIKDSPNLPKIVIWENVPGVMYGETKKAFDKYLTQMSILGYNNSYKVLDSNNYGSPQKRKRIFVVSSLIGIFDFDRLQTKGKVDAQDYLEKGLVGEKYTIKSPSMLKALRGEGFGKLYPVEDYFRTITVKQDRVPNAGVVKVTGDTYRLLTEKECWRAMGFSDEDYYKAESVQNVREGFKNTALYKQAGNAMSLEVMTELMKHIINHLKEEVYVRQN